MTEEIKQTCVAEDEHIKKSFLYKPFEGKKRAWVNMVKNLIEMNTDEELISALNKMSQAEEIPIKWNKINKPKFMNFMKHMMEDQEDCARDMKLWELVAKDLKEQKVNKTKEDKNKLEKERKILDSVIVIKPLAVPVEEEPTCIKHRVLPKSRGEMEEVTDTTPTKLVVLPKSQKNLNYNYKKKQEWSMIIQQLIQSNKNEELTSALQKISTAENIPHVKKWHEIQKGKFENFLNNIPGYHLNPVIDEQLRILISKARQEQQIKENNDKYLAKGYPTKPIQNERNAEWLTLLKSFVGHVGSISEEIPSDAYQRIIQHGEIPKKFYGIKNPDFKKFLKNNLDYEVSPKISDQIWGLISKVLEEQKETKAKILVNKKAANKLKATKRKTFIENESKAVNGNGTNVKRIKEDFKSAPLKSESCDQGNSTVCERGAQPSIKVKWNTIAKTILRAQDANEMSVKKFQKKIVVEYLKKTGNGDSAESESAEVLWCKCQKKLSKNSKFKIDSDKIQLVS